MNFEFINNTTIPKEFEFVFERIKSGVKFSTPDLIFLPSLLKKNFQYFNETFANHNVQVYFPVKTNNQEVFINEVNKLVCGFEIASVGELNILKKLEINPSKIIFSNPIKPIEAIQAAYNYGINTFAFDSHDELEKLAIHAPNSMVYVRIKVSNEGSLWKLENKFGCTIDEAFDLIVHAQKLGLLPVGLAFHVGWNNVNPLSWRLALLDCETIINKCRNEGINLDFINIGGGFPSHNINSYKFLDELYVSLNDILNSFTSKFNMQCLAEPGSFLAANTTVLLSKIFSMQERTDGTAIYIDASIMQGYYWILSGLEYFIYPLSNTILSSKTKFYKVYGPTCDSYDLFSRQIELPADLNVGDYLVIFPSGAYISSAQTYNGFPYPPFTSLSF